MARRRRPLRAVSLVFIGFVTLVLLSQLSTHFFAEAVPKHDLVQNAALLSNMRQTSTALAYSAAALGLVFAVAVLLIARQKVSADVDIYRASGLPERSAFLRLLRSHSARPLEWVAGTALVTAAIDTEFGLDAFLPVGLAIAFAALLVAWLAFLTSSGFSRRDIQPGPGGRTG